MNARHRSVRNGLILALIAVTLWAGQEWVSGSVRVGVCRWPQWLGYWTVTPATGGQPLCVRLGLGERLEGRTWAEQNTVVALRVGSGPIVSKPVGKGQYNHESERLVWQLVDVTSLSTWTLTEEDGPGLLLAPDGSRAVLVQCALEYCTYTALDARTEQEICRTGTYLMVFSPGCEFVVQRDGHRWYFKTEVLRDLCGQYWDDYQRLAGWCTGVMPTKPIP